MLRQFYFLKYIFLCIAMIVVVISCNYSDRIIKESLIIRIDLEIYKNDTIQLFYIIKTDDGYTESLSIKKYVEGKSGIQTLNFELPETIKPKNIRIDLGNRPYYQDSIKIKNIGFRYRDEILEGNNGAYKKWFIPNENIYFDKDTLVHRLKVQHGFYDPLLSGNKLLNSKLVKLFPPDIYERRTYDK